MKFSFGLSLMLMSSLAIGEDVPGQNLLSYFQSNCRTSGEWTQQALSDSTALIESIRNISQDPDCRSLGGAISNLSLLNRQLINLQDVNFTQRKISQLNYQEQELIIQLSRTDEDGERSQISQYLRSIQVERAGLLSDQRSQKELSDPSRASVMSDVIKIADSTFAQITANQRCLVKNPSILQGATSIIATVGATAAIVNPALGLGLSAGAAFLGSTIEGARTLKDAKKLRKVADYSVAYEGYKCALETMSNRWCQMQDAEAFLSFKSEQRLKLPNNPGLGRALRLNDREIPVLLEWLNKIRSGVTPTTTADASRQSTVFARENKVRSWQAYGVGVIEENRVVFNNLNSQDDRYNILRSTVNLLSPMSGGGFYSTDTTPNPFYDVLTPSYAPFFLLGLKDTSDLQNPSTGSYYTLENWPGRLTYVPNFDLLKERFNAWVDLAQNRVSQELTQVLQPDAEQTISSAFDRTGNRWKLSPMDSLKALIEFLETNPPGLTDTAFRKIYKSTLSKLRLIYDTAQNYVLLDNSNLRDPQLKTAVEEIYDYAQLKYGTVVLAARLDMIVRLSLVELISTSSEIDQTVVAQLLAADRFSETISKMNGTENLAVIRQDIQNAQPITISNLDSFAEIFGGNINKILRNLYEKELSHSGTIAKTLRNQRSQMCHLLLSVPSATDEFDLQYCKGLKLDALVSGAPSTTVLTEANFTQDFSLRACTYRNYLRSNKIYENWNTRN